MTRSHIRRVRFRLLGMPAFNRWLPRYTGRAVMVGITCLLRSRDAALASRFEAIPRLPFAHME